MRGETEIRTLIREHKRLQVRMERMLAKHHGGEMEDFEPWTYDNTRPLVKRQEEINKVLRKMYKALMGDADGRGGITDLHEDSYMDIIGTGSLK